MVRLITQNLLSCPSRACAYPTNFPLSFRNVERLEMVDAEFNEEFMRGVLSRIEWNALRKSAAEVSFHRLFSSRDGRVRIASEDRPCPHSAHLRQTGTGLRSVKYIAKVGRSHNCRRRAARLERSMDAEEGGDLCRSFQALEPVFQRDKTKSSLWTSC